MSLRLAAPLLLALGVPLVLLVAWRVRTLPSSHAGPRRRAIQIALVLAALCAALALARLELGSRLDRVAVVFAIDRSRSVDRPGDEGAAEAFERARRATESMRADDLAGVVVFGAEAATEVVPSPRPPLARSTAPIPRDATDLGAAIRRALADLPAEHAGRVVLVSDGVETQGDALAAAQIAAGRGVAIDVLPIERAPRPEIAVERVQMPRAADPGQPIELRIVTRATHDAEVRVRVSRDGAPIAEGTTHVRAGGDVLTMRDVASDPGVHRYDVLIEPVEASTDGAPENNEGGAFLRVSGASRALVLSDRPEEAGALAEAIRRAGLDVEVRGREGVPVDLGELASFDLLVLSDLNARAFTQDQMQAVRAYVRDMGGGLLMTGVRDAFGLGGYAYTPIEEVLPATFDLRRRRDRASLAMVIAIDKSGSMTVEVAPGVMKLDLANEAAARSAELLSPMDRVAVAHVDTEVTWTLPMTSVTNPAMLAGPIRAAQPGGGGIYVDVTLDASFSLLREQQTQLKHLLLFSDGSDSEEMNRARTLVTEAARAGITTSIVSMGAGPDSPELEVLSRLGNGRFYIVDDMTELPRIFTQETIAASRSAVVEEAFRPTAGSPSQATEGVDFASAPALDGFVVVNARPRASTLAIARGEDPLLLEWQAGVGRGAVFATDAGARFARSWLSWPGYARMFGQLARTLARSPERRDAGVHLAMRGSEGEIRVEAIDEDGRYRNYLELVATVAAPGGRSIEVPLAQTGPGRYESRFDASAPGSYLVTVREVADDEGRGGLVGTAGLVRARGDELRGEGTDRARLAQIAALTGGQVLADLDRVFVDRPEPAWAYAPLWQELLLAAMWLMLISVALRRLVLPREWLERLVPARLRAPARRPPAPTPLATLEALRSAKQRAHQEVAPEIARAQQSADAPIAPPVVAPPRSEPTATPPEAPRAPAPPSSLAESLLERKKKRR
ncbi:VWA domain-containing protein [Sandaracinus amylolyticus]|uniref:VWA domain-containing protein n=1 Tax=Sandaracinus amylolyticus TaxID=927083 RepID=UPI001F306ED4|nr:VWA domain-containing protein [Sandaracinus amylolyticus]UJR79733.1 von Willebrand factor type A domain protein [Sandaracinus amylolyticus]